MKAHNMVITKTRYIKPEVRKIKSPVLGKRKQKEGKHSPYKRAKRKH